MHYYLTIAADGETILNHEALSAPKGACNTRQTSAVNGKPYIVPATLIERCWARARSMLDWERVTPGADSGILAVTTPLSNRSRLVL